MSHIVTCRAKLQNREHLVAAIEALQAEGNQLQLLGDGSHEVYMKKVDGTAIQLAGWRYPVVVDVNTGEVTYDNYRGRWGDEEQLDLLFQQFAIEGARATARQQGLTFQEFRDEQTGEVEVTMSQSEFA